MKIREKEVRRLQKLKEIADSLQEALDMLVEEANMITQERDKSGHTFDYVLNNVGTAEELLEKLKIKVR